MGHDAPPREMKQAIAVIAGDRYRPGMMASDIKAANGLVIVGEITDDAKRAIEVFALKHGHRVEIVPLDEAVYTYTTPLVGEGLTSVVCEAPKFSDVNAFVIQRMKVVEPKRINTPPWAGKKPWWQR